VGVRRRRIEVVVDLLDILAMIRLGVRQSEQTLLQDRVLPIPQGEPQTKALLLIAQPRDAILAPAIRAAPRVIVREVFPRRSAPRIILPNRPPLALAEIGSPQTPGRREIHGLV